MKIENLFIVFNTIQSSMFNYTSTTIMLHCTDIRPRVLATGDGQGAVRVWRLSSALTVQGSNEINQLSELAAGII